MAKILEVITPFFTLEVGDRFELSKDGKDYVAENDEQYDRAGENGESFVSTYQSKFTISTNYAESLVKEGYLKEVKETKEQDSPFVNVFDEIDNLLTQYTKELAEVEKDKDPIPACLKVEKTTVLHNLIKVLTHLKGLKK